MVNNMRMAISNKSLYYRELDSFRAKQISRLERKLRKPGERMGKSRIKCILETADLAGTNLSFGLYAKHRLIGYVISIIDDQVILIIDLALRPSYGSQLRALITRLDQQIYAFGPGMPVQIRTRPATHKRLSRLQALPHHFHYRLVDPTDSVSNNALRWEMEPAQRHLAESPLPLPEPIWQCQINDETVDVIIIRNPRQWLALREEWDHLPHKTHEYNVFLSFEYLWLWWKYFGISHKLCILVFRHANKTVAVAPFMETLEKYLIGMVNTISFIAAPSCSNLPQCITGADSGPYLHASISFFFHNKQWDCIQLSEQRVDYPLVEEIKARFIEEKWLVGVLDDINYHRCPYIELTDTWNEFRRQLPRKMRKNLNRSKNLLKKHGAIKLKTISTWPDLDDALKIYRNIERKSWKVTKDIGFGSDAGSTEFYRSLAKYYGPKGGFIVRLLMVGEAYIAGTFGILFDGVFYSLMTTFDQKYAQSSPGTYLEALELEDLFGANVRKYDPLCGMLGQKMRWTSTTRNVVDLMFYRPRSFSLIPYLTYFVIKPKLKSLLVQLRLIYLAKHCQKILQSLSNSYYERFFPSLEVRRCAANEKPGSN